MDELEYSHIILQDAAKAPTSAQSSEVSALRQDLADLQDGFVESRVLILERDSQLIALKNHIDALLQTHHLTSPTGKREGFKSGIEAFAASACHDRGSDSPIEHTQVIQNHPVELHGILGDLEGHRSGILTDEQIDMDQATAVERSFTESMTFDVQDDARTDQAQAL